MHCVCICMTYTCATTNVYVFVRIGTGLILKHVPETRMESKN